MKRKFLSRNFLWWFSAIFVVIFIKIFSLNPYLVEEVYTYGIYPYFSKFFRFLFGWVPFSIGDIFYILAGIWLLYKIIKNVRLVKKNGFRIKNFLSKVSKALLVATFIYIFFNLFWGLNYNRLGIAYQLGLKRGNYDTAIILELQNKLLQKVNSSKLSLIRDNATYPGQEALFIRAAECYRQTNNKYPYLNYHFVSIKSSMFGRLGNYLGFTGYYNPFSGEAQVNTTVPEFILPNITTHEIGHQLGYAKENEASFVGYLAAINSTDTLFHYSTYLELYLYTNREIFFFDSVAAKNSFSLLIEPVKKDIEEWRSFNMAHQSFLHPLINWGYGKFLKLNEQPKGMRSYNEVVALLLAYFRKYGGI